MLSVLLTHKRSIFAFIFLACVALLSTAYYMEYVQGLDPCPLCMAQRLVFMALAITALIGLIHGSTGVANKIYASVLSLIALGGAAIAGRQVWLQSLPADQVPACGPGFDYIMGAFPFLKAVETLWKGSGSCAEVVWQFLGLSIAGWALVWFIGFAILGIYQALRTLPKAH